MCTAYTCCGNHACCYLLSRIRITSFVYSVSLHLHAAYTHTHDCTHRRLFFLLDARACFYFTEFLKRKFRESERHYLGCLITTPFKCTMFCWYDVPTRVIKNVMKWRMLAYLSSVMISCCNSGNPSRLERVVLLNCVSWISVLPIFVTSPWPCHQPHTCVVSKLK